MAARLTIDQLAELERNGGSPLLLEDAENHREYVLVPTEVYRQAKPFLDAAISSAYSLGHAVRTVRSPPNWNDAKNERRCALVDKKYDKGLSPEEVTELEGLQGELADHLRHEAPRPLAMLELIEEGLKHRAATAGRKE